MHPHRPTPTDPTRPTFQSSLPATVVLAGLLLWSDGEDCDACMWAVDSATRTVLGEDRWGYLCPYHLGYLAGLQQAGDWHPDEYAGRAGGYRLARRLAAVLLALSRQDYSHAIRRTRRDHRAAVRSGQ